MSNTRHVAATPRCFSAASVVDPPFGRVFSQQRRHLSVVKLMDSFTKVYYFLQMRNNLQKRKMDPSYAADEPPWVKQKQESGAGLDLNSIQLILKVYICKQCGWCCYSKNKLHKHMKIHNARYYSYDNDKLFRFFHCKQCNISFPCKSELEKHRHERHKIKR